MRKLFFVSFLLLILAITGVKPVLVQATATGPDYTVVPNLTSHQRAGKAGYFDLRLAPNQADDLSLTITNEGKIPRIFQISVQTATTNQNGLVDYTQSQFKKDPSLKIAMKDLVSPVQQTISLGAGETRQVGIHLQLPNQSFDGILLGGITVKPKVDFAKKAGIQNLFMHTIAIRVSQNDQVVSPDLQAGKVTIGQENQHNQVQMALRNPKAKLLSELTGKLIVKQKKTKQVLQTKTVKDLSIAPNSCFDLPLSLQKKFKPGTYTYTVQLKNHDGSWNFTKDFTIKAAEAKKYNQKSVDQNDHSPFSLIKGILLLIVIFMLFIIGYMWWDKRKAK